MCVENEDGGSMDGIPENKLSLLSTLFSIDRSIYTAVYGGGALFRLNIKIFRAFKTHCEASETRVRRDKYSIIDNFPGNGK